MEITEKHGFLWAPACYSLSHVETSDIKFAVCIYTRTHNQTPKSPPLQVVASKQKEKMSLLKKNQGGSFHQEDKDGDYVWR